MKRRQHGLATVELAIIATLLLMVIFGVIEIARALYMVNTLTEATRRGARMAAVCPIGDPKPASVAVFDAGGGSSAIVSGLTTANVSVEYLDTSGNVIANPAGNFSSIRYVRVRIVDFTQSLIIPFIMPSLSLSGFSTTLPRESLGIPRVGVVTPC
jgi:Flp pilus assembly protein TadG